MQLGRILAVAVMLVAAATPVSAEVFKKVWRDINVGFHRNRCWPHPFIDADDMSVRAPFGVMMHNGWRLQTLVAAHHFDQDTTVVNEAGQRHIQWIITQAPQHRRSVFVERGVTPEETAARVAAVLEVGKRLALDGQVVDVQESHVISRGWPAEYVDAINVRFSESHPDPRLPGGGGGGGGQ